MLLTRHKPFHTAYYLPDEVSEELTLLREIDQIHLKYPFYGSSRIRNELNDQGFPVGRKKVQHLIRKISYETPWQAELEIGYCFQFYNERHRHQSLD